MRSPKTALVSTIIHRAPSTAYFGSLLAAAVAGVLLTTSAQGDNVCVPLRNAAYKAKQPSEETISLVETIKASYKDKKNAITNSTYLEELRGSGLVISPNYPCGYSNDELCGWVLYAEDAPQYSNTLNRSSISTRGGRSRIRLRFVSFITEPTYDQLFVVLFITPPRHYTVYQSLSGNLPPNYTIEVDSNIIGLLFTASKAKTESGFLIDFTTVFEEGSSNNSHGLGDLADHSHRWSALDIATAVSVSAVVVIGSAMAFCMIYKKRLSHSREKDLKPVERSVVYTAKAYNVACVSQAMPNDAISNMNGLVFGGIRRPDVLLLYCEDDRAHCAVVAALAQILRSLGGCDVRTIPATQHSKQRQSHNNRSAAIGCDQLQSAAQQADRLILFASHGADLVQEAFLCGKVYPRLYRASAAYLAIPRAIHFCTSCSAVRAKTIVVVYDFREDGRQSVVNGIVASSDGNSSSSHRSSIAWQLGANVPEFRLLEDMQRLVAALHSVTPAEAAAANSFCPANASSDVIELLLRAQAPIIWSCSEEYEASNERRHLMSCVAAVERSAMQGCQSAELFEAAHGPAVDWLDENGGLMGSVGAMPLSVTAESQQLSLGGVTDVVTLPSVTGLCASSNLGLSESSTHVGHGGSSSYETLLSAMSAQTNKTAAK